MFSFFSNQKDFTGSHVFITGGSEGLGYSLAEQFLKEKANVTIISRSESKLAKAKESLSNQININKYPGRIHYEPADTTDIKQIESAANASIKEIGPIDVLVCNVGKAEPGYFLDIDADTFKSQMNTNYMSTINTTKTIVPNMIQRKTGTIVIISSELGILGLSGFTAYSPTKWALRGFSDCLRMELLPYNIDVAIAYPPDMKTPGHEMEISKTIPEVLEMYKVAGDSIYNPNDIAISILYGLKKRKYHLPTPDLLQNLSQASMAGLTPGPYYLPVQIMIVGLSAVLYAFYLRTFDGIARKFTERKMRKYKKS